MSGPLASWVAQHSKAAPVARAVGVQLALTCNHDGSPSEYVPTWADLEHRTGYSRAAIHKAVRELLDLGEIQAAGPTGGGRGRPTPYRVNAPLCDPTGGCWACDTLRSVLNGPPGRPFREVRTAEKSPRGTRKGPRQARKGPRSSPTTENGGTAPTLGGAVSPPESDDRAPLRSAASGSAARSGSEQQEQARNESVHFDLPDLAPVPAAAWAALGRAVPDDGERYGSREEEEATKRARARLLVSDPDPPNPEPCPDCPEERAG